MANLTLVAGKLGRSGRAGGGPTGHSIVPNILPSVVAYAAASFSAVRLGLLWPVILLTPALLPKCLYPTRTFRPHFREYRDCDPALWEGLRDLVFRGARCVHCFQAEGLLPEGTQFYDAHLGYMPKPLKKGVRETLRQDRCTGALRSTDKADLVCVDPDNSVKPEGPKAYNDVGLKFAYDDLRTIRNTRRGLSTPRKRSLRGRNRLSYHRQQSFIG